MRASLIDHVRHSFAQVGDTNDLARGLYDHLFRVAPETKSLFGDGVEVQARRMAETIVAFVQHLDDPSALDPLFERLAARHVSMGVEPDHFDPVGVALLASLRDQLGDGWTEDVEASWTQAYDVLSRALKRQMWMARERQQTQADGASEAYATTFLAPPSTDLTSTADRLPATEESDAIEVEFLGEKTVPSSADQTILQISLQHGIPHYHECGGSARCSTCRVEIVEGQEHCTPRTPSELAMARTKRFGERIRLACQTRVRGPVKLRRLLFDRTDVSAVMRGVAQTPGRELHLAVMFLDIRGFTPLTERHLPYDVVHILNRFFNVVGEAMHAHHGYIDKYLGDGLMALFGLNEERIEHPCVDAVGAALEAHAAVLRENAYFRDHFGADLDIGIGIHYGPAIVGDVGYWRKQQLTALGDVVNAAARIEAATKDVEASILLSDEVRRAIEEIAPETCAFGASADLELKGKCGLHRIHEVQAAGP